MGWAYRIRYGLVCLILVLCALNGVAQISKDWKPPFPESDENESFAQCLQAAQQVSRDPSIRSYFIANCYWNRFDRTMYLDSAYRYAMQAAQREVFIKPSWERKLAAAGYSISNLMRLIAAIEEAAFERAQAQGSVAAWDHFLSFYPTAQQHAEAQALRTMARFEEILSTDVQDFDHLEQLLPEVKLMPAIRQRFEQVMYERFASNGSAEAFRQFAERFPESAYASQAQAHFYRLRFEQACAEGTAAALLQYMKDFPQSPHAMDADRQLFELLGADNQVQGYLSYITQNPDGRYVDRAWQQIFALEVPVITPQGVHAFLKKYPANPLAASLRKEVQLLGQKFYTYMKNGLHGYVQLRTGDTLTAPLFEEASLFSEGRAAVRMPCSTPPCPYAYLTLGGRLITTYPWVRAGDFYKGRAIAAIQIAADLRYGFINHAGEWVVPPQFQEVYHYAEGRCLVRNEWYGYLNEKGELVIPCQFSKATTFSEGLAAVQDRTTGLYGFIDRNGQYVIQPRFTDAASFREGLAAVANDEGKWGFIDRSGKWVIQPLYEFALPFINGKAKVLVRDGNSNSSHAIARDQLIDRTGRRIAH